MSDQENATEPPSSPPMTLRQQVNKLYTEYWHSDIGGQEFQEKMVELCQEIAREAVQRYQELQHEELMNEIIKTDREARLDELNLMANHSWSAHRTYLFDRIAELTQKPPQPPQGGLEEVSDGSS